MAEQDLPTPETLRKLLSYDADTGILTWLARPVEMFKDGGNGAEHNAARWNGMYAGKPALQSPHKDGYCHGHIFGKLFLAHRVIWAIVHGEWPTNHIDHISGVRNDNRIENMRDVTRQENGRNVAKPTCNTSGVIGVYWHKATGKWTAAICVNRKLKHIGLFASFDDAVAARKCAEAALGFHTNHGRAA